MQPPYQTQGHNPRGENQTSCRKEGWPGRWIGRPPKTTLRKNIIHPDTQRPQDNGMTGTKRSDGKTTPGTPRGYAWRVLPRRILLHLPQKTGTTKQVLRHPPKPRVHNLPHMRERVPRWSDVQSGKTPARRQWLLQGTPWQPAQSLHANHIQGHTSRSKETTTAV